MKTHVSLSQAVTAGLVIGTVWIGRAFAAAASERDTARATPRIEVEADLAVSADYPLTKSKFGGFNSGIVNLPQYRRDIGLFDEVRLPSLRIDLGWGARWAGWARQPVTGTAGAIHYDFEEMDGIAELLNQHGVLPYWSYCYIPEPLQARPGDYRAPDTNHISAWGDILAEFAKRSREGRQKIGYHEIYNEPDNRDFFRGSLEDYLKLYREGSRRIRQADPDAVVGGPAVAFTDAWVAPFLDFVERENLPLDFYSFHFYPTVPYKSHDIAGVVADMRRELARHPRFATTEMHLNEYNSYRIDYPKGGRQDHYPLASALLHDYLFFLSQPDLTHVNWAQFMDSGHGNFSGMISIEGRRKAVFNAAALYARMPVDRRQLVIKGSPDIEGMASADKHTAGVLLWNRSGADQSLSVGLRRAPFSRGRLRVYRIDAAHGSWGDDPAAERLLPIETRSGIRTGKFNWTGSLPTDGVVYLELDDESGVSEFQPVRVARVVRVFRSHPNRYTKSYADFDRGTWTARLGMSTESQALEQIGVLADQWPPRLKVLVQVDGSLRKLDANSLLGVRLDYEVGTNYTSSVLFHGPSGRGPDLYDPKRDAPMFWGTQRPADGQVAVKALEGFEIEPSRYAPGGWTGRAVVTFLVQNTGPGTRARFQLTGD